MSGPYDLLHKPRRPPTLTLIQVTEDGDIVYVPRTPPPEPENWEIERLLDVEDLGV